jgi:hypothetical protein
MIRKIYQWNQDRKEPQDVQDQDQTFEMSESFAANSVDCNRKCKHCPAEEHSLIGFRRVICVQHQNSTLQDSPGQIGRRGSGCLPPNQCDPSRDEAEKVPARFRCKNSDPALRKSANVFSCTVHGHILILSTCSRCHGSQFREDCVDRNGTNPYQDVSPKNAGWATIKETGRRNSAFVSKTSPVRHRACLCQTHCKIPSQVTRTVQENPSICMKPKFLFKTGFLPNLMRSLSSRV